MGSETDKSKDARIDELEKELVERDKQLAEVKDRAIKREAEQDAEIERLKRVEPTGRTDEGAEIERSHAALAMIRKLAMEQPNVSAADVVRSIGRCEVDTSDFDRLAAGV